MYWLPVILLLPYLFLLLGIYRSLRRIKPFNVSTHPLITVSVIVPCRNEKENIPKLLNCIARQDYPHGIYEVIVVDDNSTDGTFEAASGFSGTHNIIVIKNKGKGKKQAIKTGINASSGILIITTDADCSMGNSWIRTIAAFYETHKPDMILCPVKIDSGPGFFNRFQELEFLSLQGITAGSSSSGNSIMCNGANLSYTKEVYLNHMDNLHDEIASGDDVFLLHSLKKHSRSKILWLESESVMVTASSAPSILSFLKQRKRWISKVKAYDDKFTILLGIVTFVTIIVQLSVMFAGLINPYFIAVFITIFILKSVPDFMILMNTSVRYGKRNLMPWFLPAQLLYPLYVLCVVLYSIIFLRRGQS